MAQFTTRLTDMKMSSLCRLSRCGMQCVYQRTVSFRFHSVLAAVKIVRPHIKVVFYRGAENCSKKIGWINNTAKMLQDGKFLIETFVSGLACISWPGYAKKMDGVITNALSYLSDVCWQQTRFATNLKFRIINQLTLYLPPLRVISVEISSSCPELGLGPREVFWGVCSGIFPVISLDISSVFASDILPGKFVTRVVWRMSHWVLPEISR